MVHCVQTEARRHATRRPQRRGEEIDRDTHEQILVTMCARYTAGQDIRYAAARGWADRIIEAQKTREVTAGWAGVLQT